MKIGIIGAGNVGTSLASSLAREGHTIVYGVRDPASDKYAALKGPNVEVRSVREAVEAAELVILATPWAAAEAALSAAGDFAQKTLIDATNPIGPGFALTHGHTDSGAEQVARWAKNARVVKAFNTTGAENMADPTYGEQRVAMFVCGDDEQAVAAALQLAKDIGFDAVHAGNLAKARLVEPMAMMWINLAMARGHGRGIAFGMLRRGQKA